MGFFDRDVIGGLDAMFDFNHDGVLDGTEQLIEMMFLDDANAKERKNERNSDSDSDGEDW